MKSYTVAIVGAAGLVGQEFIKILQQRQFPLGNLRLFTTDRSAGKKVSFSYQDVLLEELHSSSFKHVDLALFSAGAEASCHFVPVAMKDGAVVLDTTAAFRLEEGVPLVVPEINPQDLRRHSGLIANPCCIAIQIAMALFPIHRVNPVRRVIVDSYQAVSGSGASAMEELSLQARLILEGKNVIPHIYPHQIAFNLLPEIDVFLDNGYSKEEWRIVRETRKIMHAPEIAISATAVRVPVYIGYSAALHVEFSSRITPEEARGILGASPGVRILDDPSVSLYPQPWVAAGQDDVFVGRIREDISLPNGLALWVVTDNVRKGTALNAVQIAETLIEQGWL
ncbi:MAG: aspartate-semialdehyde dehydrogenase [Chloroflexi bacterium]|nr:aspartate-semialdehyde dehydrogenase [Chloroflexota bacterium]MBI5956776.1 aspartate-semialdehyde dehydrogenase [Chloroflexota bacterium]